MTEQQKTEAKVRALEIMGDKIVRECATMKLSPSKKAAVKDIIRLNAFRNLMPALTDDQLIVVSSEAMVEGDAVKILLCKKEYAKRERK